MGQIAKRFRIPKGTVQNILERYRDEGTLEPKAQNAGRKSVFSKRALRALERDVRKHPDATLEELRQRSQVQASLVTFHNALKRLGFTRKKNSMCDRETVIGRSPLAPGVADVVGHGRFSPTGFSGRNGRQDQHDAGLWPG